MVANLEWIATSVALAASSSSSLHSLKVRGWKKGCMKGRGVDGRRAISLKQSCSLLPSLVVALDKHCANSIHQFGQLCCEVRISLQ